jgi:hypothetical protein
LKETGTMTENTKMSLAELKALMANFSAAELKAAVKEQVATKATKLSLTHDAIVAAAMAGPVLTDNVYKALVVKAAEHGITDCQQTSVAALIRYADSYMSALTRAGYVVTKKPATETTEGDKAPELPKAPDSNVVSPVSLAAAPTSHRKAA